MYSTTKSSTKALGQICTFATFACKFPCEMDSQLFGNFLGIPRIPRNSQIFPEIPNYSCMQIKQSCVSLEFLGTLENCTLQNI